MKMRRRVRKLIVLTIAAVSGATFLITFSVAHAISQPVVECGGTGDVTINVGGKSSIPGPLLGVSFTNYPSSVQGVESYTFTGTYFGNPDQLQGLPADNLHGLKVGFKEGNSLPRIPVQISENGDGSGTWTAKAPLMIGLNEIWAEVTRSDVETEDLIIQGANCRASIDVENLPLTPTTTSSSDSGGGSSDSGGGGGGGGGDEEPQQPPKKGKVLGATTGISLTDRKAKNFIKNATVPLVVNRIFKEVFGRKSTKAESTYWKGRARSDKATESKLKGAMLFHKLKGRTMPGNGK